MEEPGTYDYAYDTLSRLTITASNSYGQADYYHQDGLGGVVGLSNNQNTTTQTQRFDAWGNKLTGTVPQTAQYGYAGREPDETGLIYYRARYYDPAIGRFTQRDPIGLNGGINLYAYVGNNPVNYTDPLGLRELTAGEFGMMSPIFSSTVLQSVDVQQGANWNPVAWFALNVMDRPAITLNNTVHIILSICNRLTMLTIFQPVGCGDEGTASFVKTTTTKEGNH